MEPEKEDDAAQLSCIFIGQSNPDIKCQLQKLEGTDSWSLNELLETAWKAYNNRKVVESKKERKESVGKENCWL